MQWSMKLRLIKLQMCKIIWSHLRLLILNGKKMEATIIKKMMKPMWIVCSDKTNNTLSKIAGMSSNIRLKLTDKKLIILQIQSKSPNGYLMVWLSNHLRATRLWAIALFKWLKISSNWTKSKPLSNIPFSVNWHALCYLLTSLWSNKKKKTTIG
jgi:hypothetical protein